MTFASLSLSFRLCPAGRRSSAGCGAKRICPTRPNATLRGSANCSADRCRSCRSDLIGRRRFSAAKAMRPRRQRRPGAEPGCAAVQAAGCGKPFLLKRLSFGGECRAWKPQTHPGVPASAALSSHGGLSQTRPSHSGCPGMSPSSWMATAAGLRRRASPGLKATAAAWREFAAPPSMQPG